jgi:hypothetical protein
MKTDRVKTDRVKTDSVLLRRKAIRLRNGQYSSFKVNEYTIGNPEGYLGLMKGTPGRPGRATCYSTNPLRICDRQRMYTYMYYYD